MYTLEQEQEKGLVYRILTMEPGNTYSYQKWKHSKELNTKNYQENLSFWIYYLELFIFLSTFIRENESKS